MKAAAFGGYQNPPRSAAGRAVRADRRGARAAALAGLCAAATYYPCASVAQCGAGGRVGARSGASLAQRGTRAASCPRPRCDCRRHRLPDGIRRRHRRTLRVFEWLAHSLLLAAPSASNGHGDGAARPLARCSLNRARRGRTSQGEARTRAGTDCRERLPRNAREPRPPQGACRSEQKASLYNRP